MVLTEEMKAQADREERRTIALESIADCLEDLVDIMSKINKNGLTRF